MTAAEPLEWMPDGTPYSPRFGDRYHSENGGLSQSKQVFLAGCGLPAAWSGQHQWRILETGFGFGLNFLVTWAAWRADPQRCTVLHFVSTEAWPVGADDLLRATTVHPELAPLARELHAQWWGLLPGVHRLRFDEGRVLLTLCIGDTQKELRQQQLTVDSVYLDGFSPKANPDSWSLHTLKAVARCCRRGTQLATWTIARAVRDDLAQCGFDVAKVPGVPPKRDNLHAVYNPRWEPRTRPAHSGGQAPEPTPQAPGHCLVIGAGIAGAAVAASLARRGWQVQVLDAASAPASGASGLPAGLFAPHVSPDDSLLSRLSRAGVRTTLAQLQELQNQPGSALKLGRDWAPTGVLEHRVDGTPGLGASWPASAGTDWSHAATPEQLAQAGLPAHTAACWHQRAGWLRPAALVRALLQQPGVHWQCDSAVARLVQVDATTTEPAGASAEASAAASCSSPSIWQALDAQGRLLAQASLVVIAGGAGSEALLPPHWPLVPVRGQVSWGVNGETASTGTTTQAAAHAAPPAPFPVNGHGNLVPAFGLEAQDVATMDGVASSVTSGMTGWVMGSTFERDVATLPASAADQHLAHATNADKLRTLLPAAAQALQGYVAAALGDDAAGTAAQQPSAHSPEPTPAPARNWAAVRCTSADRLPIVGPVDAAQAPGLWVSTAMGSRGLTLAVLCGELLAARLQGEPLPLAGKLAQALGSERLRG